jgi:hypothetical protein
MRVSPHSSSVSATASQVLPWLRYVSAHDPQRVKNTIAVVNLTCLATKGLKTPRDETGEISGLERQSARLKDDFLYGQVMGTGVIGFFLATNNLSKVGNVIDVPLVGLEVDLLVFRLVMTSGFAQGESNRRLVHGLNLHGPLSAA